MELVLVGVFLVASVVGYFVIRQVPSLLHTPLMSGMNALSGVTILGAVITAAAAENAVVQIIALVAAALAAVNVVGGFAVTHRMLKMFGKKGAEEKQA